MYRKHVTLIIMLAILLTGCSKAETVEPTEVVETAYAMDSIIWDNKTFNAFTPVMSFESTDTMLTIFPYYASDQYITIEKIIISDNAFWKSVIKQYSDTEDLVKKDKYSYVTSKEGVTYGYLDGDTKTSGYLVTSKLPSSYVDAALKMLCSTST